MYSPTLRALGLMSGTSVDGVDVALIETDGEKVASVGAFLTVPYADEVRQQIRSAFGADRPSDATRAAERAVTQAHVEAVQRWSLETGTALPAFWPAAMSRQTMDRQPLTWDIVSTEQECNEGTS